MSTEPTSEAAALLKALRDDMLTMARVAGQASVEELDSDRAQADARFADCAGQWAKQVDTALAACPVVALELVEFLERWTHDGRLQTFEDRRRFRSEAQTVIEAVRARALGTPQESKP